MTTSDQGDGTANRGAVALARLVGVPVEEFATRYWDREPLLSPAAVPDRDLVDLLDLAAVDELLSQRGLRAPFVRVVRDGVDVDRAQWTRSGGAGAQIGDQLADDRLAALYSDGATIVLQGLHRTWPPVRDLATTLAAELGHPVQVNAYVTPPQSRGFGAHYDTHDVVVVQVAGEKRWRIHAPVVERPTPDEPWTLYRDAVADRSREEPVLDVVLRPGDTLYLPRGTIHAAEALGGACAHLTFGVHPVTRAAVAAAAARAAVADDPSLRAALPLGIVFIDPSQLGGDVAQVLKLLAAALPDVDPTRVATDVVRRAIEGTRPAPVAPLTTAAATRALTGDSVVERRPGLLASVVESGRGVRLVLPDRALDLPASVTPALRAALRGGAVRVDELPGLDGDDAVVFARRLLREGALVVVAGAT